MNDNVYECSAFRDRISTTFQMESNPLYYLYFQAENNCYAHGPLSEADLGIGRPDHILKERCSSPKLLLQSKRLFSMIM